MLHLRSAAAVVFLLLSGYVSSRSAYIRRASGYRTTGTGGRAGRAVAVSQEDAASDARLLEALFGSVEAAASAIEDSDPNVPSHMKVEKDPETGEPVQLRFVYVEEIDCIGCTYCASVARNTFFMEEDAGRARAFSQGTDEPETIAEAIESCPVNCISFVDYEDLCILESEREGITIDQRQAGMRHADPFLYNRRPDSKAKRSSSSLTVCNNCPTRGCKECPMYGVGRNPNYLARLEERRLKREQSGEAAVQREEEERASLVGALFDEPDAVRDDEPSAAAADEASRSGGEAPPPLDDPVEEGVVEGVVEGVGEGMVEGVVEPTAPSELSVAGSQDAAADEQRPDEPALEEETMGVVEPTKLESSLDAECPPPATASIEEQFDVLFSGGYALPDLDELDD